MPAPSIPVITGPRALTDNGYPIISWEPVPAGVTVTVSVRSVASQKNVIDERGLTGNEFKPLTPLEAGAYLLYLRAASVSNEMSAWTQPKSFTVAYTAPAGVLGLPIMAPVPLPGAPLRISDISTIFNFQPVANVGRID